MIDLQTATREEVDAFLHPEPPPPEHGIAAPSIWVDEDGLSFTVQSVGAKWVTLSDGLGWNGRALLATFKQKFKPYNETAEGGA